MIYPHDPLCPCYESPVPGCDCQCPLIEKVVEREQEKMGWEGK